MSDFDGVYETVAKTPMGDQKAKMTITTSGDTFTGNAEGAMGSSPIAGSILGSTLTWKQDITIPMPLTLDCEATVDGDTITGTVTAGAFGSFPMSGKKVS